MSAKVCNSVWAQFPREMQPDERSVPHNALWTNLRIQETSQHHMAAYNTRSHTNTQNMRAHTTGFIAYTLRRFFTLDRSAGMCVDETVHDPYALLASHRFEFQLRDVLALHVLISGGDSWAAQDVQVQEGWVQGSWHICAPQLYKLKGRKSSTISTITESRYRGLMNGLYCHYTSSIMRFLWGFLSINKMQKQTDKQTNKQKVMQSYTIRAAFV